MAARPNNQSATESQAPDLPDAAQAFAAHAALIRMQLRAPELCANPYWVALREAAYARFLAVMEAR